ncbi:T9SS type A sorting domain-containing protein [Ignavibacterium sp.]|uniref:T9SS type A sorting domain-containing protein n=2 Tax=Ignavibacterium sp. TaxID=2651167 RepID=UPI00307E2879
MKTKINFKIYLLFFIVILLKTNYSQVDLVFDKYNIYVSTYGRVSIYSVPDNVRQLYRAALLVGTGYDSVFDLTFDKDIEDSTQLLSVPSFGDYEIYGSYNNNYSGAPPNVLEKENIYCWQSIGAFIIKYTVINRELNPINAIIGLEFLPRINNNRAGGDTVTFSNQTKIISVKNSRSVGFKALSEDLKSVGMFYYFTDYESDSLFYQWLSYSSYDSLFITNPADPNVDAPAIIPAFNQRTINPNDSAIIYVAVAYGEQESEMLAALANAQQLYDTLTSVDNNENQILSDFYLNQNYPNPFNPNTVISWNVPFDSYQTLKVYDVLGNEVASLVNESRTAGSYSINFNASNLSSGVYYYKLTAGNFSVTKKMILMR